MGCLQRHISAFVKGSRHEGFVLLGKIVAIGTLRYKSANKFFQTCLSLVCELGLGNGGSERIAGRNLPVEVPLSVLNEHLYALFHILSVLAFQVVLVGFNPNVKGILAIEYVVDS